MERRFLYYLLYITLVDLREKSHETGDEKTFWIAKMLHNIPLKLYANSDPEEILKDLMDSVEAIGAKGWFDNRMMNFLESYPEYKK